MEVKLLLVVWWCVLVMVRLEVLVEGLPLVWDGCPLVPGRQLLVWKVVDWMLHLLILRCVLVGRV